MYKWLLCVSVHPCLFVLTCEFQAPTGTYSSSVSQVHTMVAYYCVTQQIAITYNVTCHHLHPLSSPQQPLSQPSHGLFITPDNIRHLATYLDDSVSTRDRYISISTGTHLEKLIEVPLAGPGELDSQVTIRLTVGFRPIAITSDSDIRVGISDGSYYNQFYIEDTSEVYACRPYSGSHEANRVSENYVTGEVTMYFQPFHKYGACHTSHDGGYTNVATFSSQLDPTKGLRLLVNRDSDTEQYRIYYFLVEVV